MVGTVNINVAASQPQKPTPPLFSFRGSPSSIRVLDCPKQIGKWAVTRVYIDVLYPDNTTKEVDCVRIGNVWVGTFEGSTIAGKVSQGYQIKADGVDENDNPVVGYVLSCGDVYILDDTNDIKALVGKVALRYLDDIPSTPTKGDALVIGEELKIYNGEEWVTISGGSSEDTYTKAEIDEKVAEIDSSISEVGENVSALEAQLEELDSTVSGLDERIGQVEQEMPTKVSDLENDAGYLTDESQTITGIESSISELGTTIGQIQSGVSALDSSVSELSSSLTDLDDLAVKYADSEKALVQMNSPNTPFMLKMNDTDMAAGNTRIVWNDGTNYIARNALRIGVPDNGETVQHIGTTNVQMGGVHNDAIVSIGGGITIFSSAEKGKTKMFMDDDRIFVTTPATVEEGQTLKAIKVANEQSRSLKKGDAKTTRDGNEVQDEPQNWHWEYVSADLPEKTSELTNDSGFVNSSEVATFRTWND